MTQVLHVLAVPLPYVVHVSNRILGVDFVIWSLNNITPGPKTIKKKTNSTPNKYQTQHARAYKVTSFLSTDCELSTDPCSRFLYSIGP